ncbi:MAG: CPBP family intramembrane metalloprotease [Alkalicoccus sp.]|nr:MAG: CPBP family intramembrane metalloprotease [Alkalicoccus sp.]
MPRNIISFLLLTFGISWSCWLIVVMFQLDTLYHPAGAVLFLLGGFGPSAAGTYFILRNSTAETRRLFRSRMFSFRRIGWKWTAVLLLVYPALFAAAAFLDWSFFTQTFPQAEGLHLMAASFSFLLLNMLTLFFLGPVSEEIGWRGFMLEELQKNTSPLKASLWIGFFWGVWHLPLFFMPGTFQGVQSLWTMYTAAYFLNIFGYSIIMTWIYNHTEKSILGAVLIHFSINFTLTALHPYSSTLFIIAALLLLTCSAVLILAHPPLRTLIEK